MATQIEITARRRAIAGLMANPNRHCRMNQKALARLLKVSLRTIAGDMVSDELADMVTPKADAESINLATKNIRLALSGTLGVKEMMLTTRWYCEQSGYFTGIRESDMSGIDELRRLIAGEDDPVKPGAPDSIPEMN